MGSRERSIAEEEIELDSGCSASGKARQKADGGGGQAKAFHLFAGSLRDSLIHLNNEKNSSLEEVRERSLEKEIYPYNDSR